MKKLLAPSLSLALLVALGGTFAGHQVALAAQGDQAFVVNMTGANEAPNAGDPNGSGTAALALDPSDGTICVDATYDIATPITGAHIHQAAAGVGGPIVVPFVGGGGPLPTPDGSSLSGCVQVDADLMQAISDDPQGYYFNLHNADFPAGAIRGQLGE